MHALDDGTGVIADIPDAAEEEAHEVGARRRSHYRLVERHAAGAVDADAARFKIADDRQFVPSDRHLDVKALIFAKLSNELGCLLHHRLRVGGEDLYAQGNLAVIAFAQFDDALDMQFEIGAILFGHERRIGRDSGRKTAPQRLFNLDQICRINEDFHSTLPGFSSRRTIYLSLNRALRAQCARRRLLSSAPLRLVSYVAAALTRARQARSPSPWTGRGIWKWTRTRNQNNHRLT